MNPGRPIPDNRPVPGFSRRALMGGALSAAAAGALPWQLQKALAETPAGPRGRLKDIEHVVILMQENRSFDHYFGALPGVRGFNDPDAITLPNGASVFEQPVPGGGSLRPFRLDTQTTSAQEIAGSAARLGRPAPCVERRGDGQLDRRQGQGSRWATTPGTTSRSTGRWRRASPSATTTSAR